MEQKTTNFKKWGWWAVAGLVTILVVAGLIIAITTSGPKPTTEPPADEDTSNQEPSESNNNNNDKEEEKPTPELPAIAQTPEVDLPKTGPETTILPIISVGIIGYVIALGATTLRRRN